MNSNNTSRENLIKNLADRKLASGGKNKALCICIARVLCFATNRGNFPKK